MASNITIGTQEQQIAGVSDDGTSEGASRAKLVRGNLVPVPFRKGAYATDNVGSVTATFQEADIIANSDGSHSAIFVSVTSDPSLTGKAVRIRFPFYGRVFGLRYERASTTCPISVGIDGVFYSLAGPHAFLENESVSVTDNEGHVLVADDLTEGVHYADITVAASATITRSVTIYGYLVEERAGYRAVPHYLNIATDAPGVVPNTDTAISKGSSANQTELRAARKIIYANITAGAITVTIKKGANTIWKRPIPANDSLEFDPGGLFALVSLTHIASAAASVTYTVIGGH